MQLEETMKIMMLIDSMYQNWKPGQIEALVEIWNEAFKDYSYKDVYGSLMDFYKNDTKGFPPLPGNLIMLIAERRMQDVAPTESDAWALVLDAIGDSIYHGTARFKELPPLVQRAVGSAYVLQTWAMLDSENLEPVRANFLRSYRALKEQAIRENANSGKMPEPVEKIEQKMDVSHLLEEKREGIPDEKRDELLRWYDDLKKKYGGGDGEYKNV